MRSKSKERKKAVLSFNEMDKSMLQNKIMRNKEHKKETKALTKHHKHKKTIKEMDSGKPDKDGNSWPSPSKSHSEGVAKRFSKGLIKLRRGKQR